MYQVQGRDPVRGWNRLEGNYDMVSYVVLKMVRSHLGLATIRAGYNVHDWL